MNARGFVLSLAVVLCALPLAAQDIPPGDDIWDSVGGGATDTTLTSADWFALCGANVPDTAVQLKGFNIPGYGTGDTVVSRLDNASLQADGDSATVRIRLKKLSFVNDGAHPCSPLSLRVREASSQVEGTMTITRDSSAGGTFVAGVPVKAIFEAVNSSGVVVGSIQVNGVLNDVSASPWSYTPPPNSPSPGNAWFPGVSPATQQPARVCRRGNKTLPARHCYQPAPKCGVQPIPVDEEPVDGAEAQQAAQAEVCTYQAEPDATTL